MDDVSFVGHQVSTLRRFVDTLSIRESRFKKKTSSNPFQVRILPSRLHHINTMYGPWFLDFLIFGF